MNDSFLLQILGNANHTTTVPGISFSSCSRLVFATLKLIKRKNKQRGIDNCIHDVYMMYTGLYTICIRSIGKVSIVYILIKPNGFIEECIIIKPLYFYLFKIKQDNIIIYIIYKYIMPG